MIRLSLFQTAYDGVAKPREMTWDQFLTMLGPHRVHGGTKEQLPAFSPAEFMPGLPRLARNVLRVWFGVLDLDKVSPQTLATVIRSLEGIDAVAYTTWSHPKHLPTSRWSVRVCVRLSRPVEAVEWFTFWPALLARFQAPSDPQCKDPGRLYFGPFAPPGTDPQAHTFQVFRGQPLDVTGLPAQFSFAPASQATEKITRERLANLAKTWKRARNETTSHLGECLIRVCQSTPFAEPGERDSTLFKLCRDLIKEWPNADPVSLSAHFAQSLQMMGGDAPSPQDVQAKLERAQADIQAEAVAKEMVHLSEAKLRIQECYAGIEPGRDWPYTEADLDTITTQARTTRGELVKRWIIQRGPVFYLLGPGGVYSPAYGEKDVFSAVLRDLAPARSAGVDLWTLNIQGEPVRKSLGQLMADYGSVANDYVLDLRAQVSTYDGASRTFTDAPCPKRDLEPTWDPEVDAWLRAFAGPLVDDLFNWLALVTDLDSTCAALMITGPGDAGKGLLAHGLSRIWTTTQPTTLEQVMGSFNAALTRCPLVFADEAIPKDFRGQGRTEELRSIISERVRPYRQKYQPDTIILGAIRLVVAANSEDILDFQQSLGPDDIRSIGERIFHVKIPKVMIEGEEHCPARAFLSKVQPATFVTQDRIAKHALWLAKHYPIRRQGRFLIQSNIDTIMALSTRGGIRSALCQWLVGYLRNPAPVDQRGGFQVRIKNGDLLIRTEAILDNWGVYVETEKVPPAGKLAQAVTNLTTEPRHAARPKATPLHYRVVNKAVLYAWVDQTEFATREDLDLALSVDTERRSLGAGFRVQGTEPN